MSREWLPPEQYIETIARSTSYACLYFTDTRGRPVQLKATYSADIWQWPGGNMDPGETPWECALRECREETGIVFDGPQRLLGAAFGLPRKDWPVNHSGFIFDGGELTDEEIAGIVLDPDEHTELRVHTLAEWEPIMGPAKFERLRRVHDARRTGNAVYLER
ncbi:NUDIX domain-containing protein [Streptomyces sp. NPDC006670]|uniref:NUDIX domain-containing protein n=1 Tax=Streptomyces sp. NPDC006670 TaxID=3154476 RepID=UPI0033E01318